MKFRHAGSWLGWVLVVGGCSGGGGTSPHETLVRAGTEPPGANCAAGGVALHSGIDENGNGVLDDNEVTTTTYVCASSPMTVGNVSGFEAIGVGDHAVLRWTNPTGAAFAGVTIRRATAGFPASPADGAAVYDGTAATVTDTGLAVGTEYFYRAFAHDAAGTYASGVDTTVLALAPGGRDPTFNAGGSILIPPELQYAGLNGLAVDGEGRPAACGFEQGATSGTGRGVVWQLDRAGSLDPLFNGGAELTLKAPPSTAYGIMFDGAGRLLVSDPGPRVSRFLGDGTRDPGFGTLGISDLALGGGAAKLALDAQGRILVWGPVGTTSMQLTRLSADGAVDATFGTAGSVRIDQLPGASSPYVYGSGVAADGTDVVVSGYGYGPSGNFDMALWRFDATGAPVTAFGTNGVVTVDGINGNHVAQSDGIAIDGMGRIVVSGSANEAANTQMVLWRFTSAGALDTTFGTAGIVVDRDAAGGTGYDTAIDLVLDGTGRIVVVGSSGNSAGGADAVTWRFLADGAPDASFGTAGRVIERGVDGIGPYYEGAAGVALDPWGRIVVGATVGPSAGNQIAIWRYVP